MLRSELEECADVWEVGGFILLRKMWVMYGLCADSPPNLLTSMVTH